jgi:type IV pilus assembly protein PilA
MRRLLRRLDADEQGFTLIELMVVVMVLGILLVIGLPTFLGVRARFQDRGAQTDLRNAVLAARIMYTDSASFTSATAAPSGLVTIVPNMCYVADASASVSTGTTACTSGTGSGSISVTATATQFAAVRLSPSTSCFAILDAATGTRYAETAAGNCNATWAITPGNVTATTPVAAGW